MEKILIIEDNLEIRENFAEILELEGYTVFTASNGRLGAEKAFAEKPDLIFCDIMMPELDGYGVLYLLAKNKETMNIPFIYLSSRSEKDDIQKGFGLGATGYIIKPFSGNEVLAAVDKALAKRNITSTFSKKNIYEQIIELIGYVNSNFSASLTLENIAKKKLQRGEILFSEMDIPQAAYFIIKGKIKSYLINNSGNEFITNRHETDEFLGYNAILENTKHKDNAVAEEETELLVIPQEIFLQLIHSAQEISRQFIKLLSGNNHNKEEKITSLVYFSLKRMLIESLLEEQIETEVSDDENSGVDLMKRKNYHKLNYSSENVFNILNDLQKEKMINIKNGKIIILEERQLKRLSKVDI